MTSLPTSVDLIADGYVPVLDIGAARDGDPEARRRIAAAIDGVCRESGFLVVTGHRIDPELIDRMHAVTLEMFAQPDEWKDQWLCDASSPTLRGLFRTGGYVAASEGIDTAPDLCELFTINRLGEPGIASADDLGDAYDVWAAPNLWPDRPEGLRETWLAYYAALEGLADDLMRLFALALGLDEHFFDDKIDEHITNLCANHYPAVIGEPLPGQYRKGPHSDWGSLTILYQDDTGGLEVIDCRTGEWVDVPVVPGAYVVNIGDLMTVWTNGAWRSTKHRVRIPAPDRRSVPRISIPFFHTPNWSAVVECLPTCESSEQPRRHEPITSGTYLLEKIRAAYS
jgi:isopenicillin N synthase-like dioxygenase